MRRPATLILVLGLAMAALVGRAAPVRGAQDGATPVASPESGVDDELLAATEGPGTDQEHRLYRVTIEPGYGANVPNAMESALLTVEQGAVALTGDVGSTVHVNHGEPIRAGDEVICDRGGTCPLEPARAVTLGAGNAASFQQGTFAVENGAAEPAVVFVAAVANPNLEGCWICPKET